MMLEEANSRLKKVQIDDTQLLKLESLYILLDLDKDDFCKIVDLVGLNTLLKKHHYFDRLHKAEEELTAKERYQVAKQRLEEIDAERDTVTSIIYQYEKASRLT